MPGDRAYFIWRHRHPHLAEDPSAAFAAGRMVGRRETYATSDRWIDLAPQVRRLADELEDLRRWTDVEAELEGIIA